MKGDYTYGGWTLYGATNAPNYTSGYVVRLSDARAGVTTAAHCSATNPKIYINGHFVTLAAAAVANNSSQYDLRVHPTGSLSTSGYIAFSNNQPIRGHESIVNSVPGYANSGYFGVQDGLYRVANTQGATMCKMGQRTGLSCGTIVSNYASYTTEDGVARSGMVALGNSSQRVIGFAGDSGGRCSPRRRATARSDPPVSSRAPTARPPTRRAIRASIADVSFTTCR